MIDDDDDRIRFKVTAVLTRFLIESENIQWFALSERTETAIIAEDQLQILSKDAIIIHKQAIKDITVHFYLIQ